MEWNPTVKQQISDYVRNPAVLMSADEEPYEFRAVNGSVNRLKRRRSEKIDIPYQLYAFLLENGVGKNQLREFGSGLFLNYCETQKIYT